MPAGCKPGERRGGREKGKPNRATLEISERLARLKCDTISGLAKIALRDVPCGVCFGKGRTKYKLPTGEGEPQRIGERVCESCFGTLKERISPETSLKAYSELAQYEHPKRKAIEHSNPDGSLQPSWVIVEPGPDLARIKPASSGND